jgi:hypothetical protein
MKSQKVNARSKDIKGVVSRQKRYSTLAKKEGQYALKQEQKEKKAHEPEMAKDSAREAKIAFSFSAMRKHIAEKEATKLRKK